MTRRQEKLLRTIAEFARSTKLLTEAELAESAGYDSGADGQGSVTDEKFRQDLKALSRFGFINHQTTSRVGPNVGLKNEGFRTLAELDANRRSRLLNFVSAVFSGIFSGVVAGLILSGIVRSCTAY